MSAKIDLTGQKFGCLIVLGFHSGTAKTKWSCKCECGNECVVLGGNLRMGRTQSCGCKNREKSRKRLCQSKTWEKSHKQIGHKTKTSKGYIRIKIDDGVGRYNYQYEHVVIMERMIGRPLLSDESVHHRNGIKTDNRPENLELWSKNHPSGQRVDDMIQFCTEYLARYAPERLSDYSISSY